ncbi:hypothetical protein TRVA0_050S00650 [Trichomonascus vanleenenianus]|uniref:uncharacterized protein n=1 Tax=Trichomonascus vanleenenianus TaxID=2268995 RepID=UPI003ECAD081
MKLLSTAATLLAAVSSVLAAAPTFSTIQPNNAQIAQAAATAVTNSFKNDKYVSGRAFDRIVIIWLENTDYDKAVGEADLKELATQGITLSNYWSLTHPSEPNYIGSVGGDYFGLGADEFVSLPADVFTVADLLDSKQISWGEYEQHLPYTGYEGWQYLNQENGANDYVRKHSPLISYDIVTENSQRLGNFKNFTEFYKDLNNQALPQWCFITPNMTNNGHDSNIQVAGNWARNFLTPLLSNSYFSEKTLVVLTFDETETYTDQNKVACWLFGDIPDNLKGTTDDTYYNHYSLLATVQNNWGLPNLGRNDCGANVFNVVAKQTNYNNNVVNTNGVYNNVSAPGWLSDSAIPIPGPNLACEGAGGPVLQQVIDAWSTNSKRCQ